MTRVLTIAALAFALTTACSAQEPLVPVRSKGGQKWPATELNKIYVSVCSAVQREFGSSRAVSPRVSLVLGADKNAVDFDKGEVLLVKWDRDLFAQGVVVLAFEDLMTAQRRVTLARTRGQLGRCNHRGRTDRKVDLVSLGVAPKGAASIESVALARLHQMRPVWHGRRRGVMWDSCLQKAALRTTQHCAHCINRDLEIKNAFRISWF